uniref:Uncharacterized protein n=1 Tax=Anguilla anguilla TaxID=7936 RepID=A0A0E9PXR5_ANGAN
MAMPHKVQIPRKHQLCTGYTVNYTKTRLLCNILSVNI